MLLEWRYWSNVEIYKRFFVGGGIWIKNEEEDFSK